MRSENGGALNPHLAYGELFKLLSAPFGRFPLLSRLGLLQLERVSFTLAYLPKRKACALHRLFFLVETEGLEPATSRM